MGNLKFGDISTKDMDLVIQFKPVYEFPKKDSETIHVPGRNGDLVIDSDSFKNVTRSYSIASVFRPGTDFIENSQRLISWLTANPGYHRLEDSYDPEVYRLAMFRSSGSLQNYYDRATILSVSFECKPQRYLKIGEKSIEYTFDQVANLEDISAEIENPTLYKSLPEITLENIPESSGTVLMFNVINYKEEITSSIALTSVPTESLTIDSERQLVYTIQNQTIKNLNKYINLNGKQFPKLDRGINKVKVQKYLEIKHTIEKYSTLIDNKKDVLMAKYLPFETVLQSKSSSAKIPSFESVKNMKQETYVAEAYGNLALDSASYYEFESFNKTLQNYCFMVGFNTDYQKGADKDKINLIEWNDSGLMLNGKLITNCTTSDFRTIDNTIAIFYNIDTNSYSIFVLRPGDSSGSKLSQGAFIQLADVTDNSYDSNKIIYVNSITTAKYYPGYDQNFRNFVESVYLGDTYSSGTGETNIIKVFSDNGISSKSFSDIPEDSVLSHDVIITLYPAKIESSKKRLNIEYNAPNFMQMSVVYSDTEGSAEQNPTIEKVFYQPSLPGYYYKAASDSGNGLLSGLISTVGGLISKLFNKSGWSKITQADITSGTVVFEEVPWDSKKKAFILGSLLSSNENYTVARYFIPENGLPQYEPEVLQDTYVLDANGQPATDVAGNKIHKTIDPKISVNTINDDLTELSSVTVTKTGFYRFNDGDAWYYYLANQQITSSDFNKSCKSSNKIDYLEKVPDYRDVDNFPEWLDPIPIFKDSEGTVISSDSNKINAAYYDFNVAKTGWYWYDFIENETSKRTIFVKLNEGDEIGVQDPDPSEIDGRKSDTDFNVYFCDYKIDADEFPIHEYEYVHITDETSEIYRSNKYLVNPDADIYDGSKSYHIGDCVYDEHNLVYLCIQDTVDNLGNNNYWKYLGLRAAASEYDEETTYASGDYCIFNRRLYFAISSPIDNPDLDTTNWVFIGEYIKNIGFYYLSESGKEEEMPCNTLPEWVDAIIIRGTLDDYSDTALEFYAIQNGLFKWDSNVDWISKNPNPTELLVAAIYKTDTTINYMNELPSYDESAYDNLYDLSDIEQSSTGNPEKVLVKAEQSGYYKIGSSTNYEYFTEDSILKELSINQDLEITYLDPQPVDSDLQDIVIKITPRWWSL